MTSKTRPLRKTLPESYRLCLRTMANDRRISRLLRIKMVQALRDPQVDFWHAHALIELGRTARANFNVRSRSENGVA